MNKKLATWIAGGLLTAAVFVFGYNATVGSAAEKFTESKTGQAAMMQMGQQDMSKMMTSEEMQKKCQEMMNNPEMQKMMQQMMNSPEMQKMMQQSSGMMPMNGNRQETTPNGSETTDSADHAAHHPAQ